MKDTLSFMILGIVISFGIGWMVGNSGREHPIYQQSPLPSNYDPERAMCGDMIKSLQAGQERCWADLVELRRKEISH